MTTLTIQVDEQVQAAAAAVLNARGLSIADVVQMTLKQIADEKRLPYGVGLPVERNNEQPVSSSEVEELTKHPAFGMWADREDMKDPAEWVRSIRRGRYRDL
jgi:addiction module RelB/DinJ family antitoxin